MRKEIYERIQDKQVNPWMLLVWRLADKLRLEHPFWIHDDINRQPEVIENTLNEEWENAADIAERIVEEDPKNVYLTGSGSSYNLSMSMAYQLWNLSDISGVPLFPYQIEHMPKSSFEDSLIIASSASGGTKETVEAAQHAKNHGADVLSIVCDYVSGGPLLEIGDYILQGISGNQYAGPEITTWTSRLIAQYILAIELGLQKETDKEYLEEIKENLQKTPDLVEQIIEKKEEKIENLAKKYEDIEHLLIWGGGASYSTAIEASLKSDEMARLNAKGFNGGESMVNLHRPGPTDKSTLTILIAPDPESKSYKMLKNHVKTYTNVIETPSLALVEESDSDISDMTTDEIFLPEIPKILSPILEVVTMQLFVYYMAVVRDQIPDWVLPLNAKHNEANWKGYEAWKGRPDMEEE